MVNKRSKSGRRREKHRVAVFEPSTPRIIELREVTSADRCASSPFFFFGLSSATGVRGLAIFRCPDSKPPTKHNIGAPRRCFFFVLLASAVVSRPVNLAADPTIPSSPSTFLARSSFSPLATSRGKIRKTSLCFRLSLSPRLMSYRTLFSAVENTSTRKRVPLFRKLRGIAIVSCFGKEVFAVIQRKERKLCVLDEGDERHREKERKKLRRDKERRERGNDAGTTGGTAASPARTA